MINVIDTLLKKNNYLKKLSDADRLSVYNIALLQIAELRNYFYTNQILPTNFAINTSQRPLSSIKSIDSIMQNDLQTLSSAERLLIYNMVQTRIADLRVLQNNHYYLSSNVYGTVSRNIIRELPITNSIILFVYRLREAFRILPIISAIRKVAFVVRKKVLSLPIAARIVLGITRIKFLSFPIIYSLRTYISYITVKRLSLPIQAVIDYLIINTLSVVNRILPVSYSITIIGEYQYLREKNLAMPINNSIKVI